MTENKQLTVFKQELDRRAAGIYKNALPTHVKPEYFSRLAFSYVANNPRLLDCDQKTLFTSLMTLAQLGLPPEGVLGQAYLVPFGKVVQPIIGYKGYITLARQSGELSSIMAMDVCKNDKFVYQYGLNERLEHTPAEKDRGELTHAYAVARYKDGGTSWIVLPRIEIEKIRDQSAGYKAFKKGQIKETPWDTNFAAMAKKSAIRALKNYMPLSVQKAAALEDLHDRGKSAQLDEDGMVIEAEATIEDDTPDLRERFKKEPASVVTAEEAEFNEGHEAAAKFDLFVKKVHPIVSKHFPTGITVQKHSELWQEFIPNLTLSMALDLEAEPDKYISELMRWHESKKGK